MYKEIKARIYSETKEGTFFYVLVPNEQLADQMHKYTDGKILNGELRIDDGRTIRASQRKKVWAMLGDISKWNGDEKEVNHWWLKTDYTTQSGESMFSLSNCSVTTARHYISFLINFCLVWDVPLSEPILDRTDDIDATLFSALMNKRCVLCGDKGEIHHEDAVGMGRKRKDIIHKGMRVVCLCRKHHTEAHNLGKTTFNDKYKVYGITATKEICEAYRLRGKGRNE